MNAILTLMLLASLGLEFKALARRMLAQAELAGITDPALPGLERRDPRRLQGSAVPGQIHAVSAPRPEAKGFPFGPGLGKGGKQLELARLALQQHLRDRGRG